MGPYVKKACNARKNFEEGITNAYDTIMELQNLVHQVEIELESTTQETQAKPVYVHGKDTIPDNCNRSIH